MPSPSALPVRNQGERAAGRLIDRSRGQRAERPARAPWPVRRDDGHPRARLNHSCGTDLERRPWRRSAAAHAWRAAPDPPEASTSRSSNDGRGRPRRRPERTRMDLQVARLEPGRGTSPTPQGTGRHASRHPPTAPATRWRCERRHSRRRLERRPWTSGPAPCAMGHSTTIVKDMSFFMGCSMGSCQTAHSNRMLSSGDTVLARRAGT